MFGIPSIINHTVSEIGTLLSVTEIVKIYDDGKMDIKTKGETVFTILENITNIPDKLYSGAIVAHLQNNINNGRQGVMQTLLLAVKKLHLHLQVNKDFKKPDDLLNTYDIAHHIGMNIQEEYIFLSLLEEYQREEYIRKHLKRMLSVIAEMESLKEKIKLNGHFKHIKGL
jgi:uncharacterized protein